MRAPLARSVALIGHGLNLVVLSTASWEPMQLVGVLIVHLQVALSVSGGGDTDRRAAAADAIRFHEQLHFPGIDKQQGIVVEKLPGPAVGGPPAANKPNVGGVAFLLFGRNTTDPQFRRQWTEVHRKALAGEIDVDRYPDRGQGRAF